MLQKLRKLLNKLF